MKKKSKFKDLSFPFSIKLKVDFVCLWQVEKALRTVASKEQEDKEQTAATKNNKNNLVEKNVVTKLIENTENKNSLKHKSALKGISQDLLNKVHVPAMSSSWLCL